MILGSGGSQLTACQTLAVNTVPMCPAPDTVSGWGCHPETTCRCAPPGTPTLPASPAPCPSPSSMTQGTALAPLALLLGVQPHHKACHSLDPSLLELSTSFHTHCCPGLSPNPLSGTGGPGPSGPLWSPGAATTRVLGPRSSRGSPHNHQPWSLGPALLLGAHQAPSPQAFSPPPAWQPPQIPPPRFMPFLALLLPVPLLIPSLRWSHLLGTSFAGFLPRIWRPDAGRSEAGDPFRAHL